MNAKPVFQHPSSYRDPSGFVFEAEGVLYRQVDISFKENFDFFIQSGCYDKLVNKGWLIPHETINGSLTEIPGHYLTIKPEKIGFISYAYEWSFDMLKDAALLTLQLAKEALQHSMVLKDATPYNIQWHKGRLVFIDTLSFEKYDERPWIAYRQFCENFLGPLLIMHYHKKQLPELLLSWPNGVPLSTVASFLPFRSRFSLYTYLHVHLHAKYSIRKVRDNSDVRNFSSKKLLNLLTSLEVLINKLKIPPQASTWSGYYEEAAQRNDYLEQKKKIIDGWLDHATGIHTAADLGANTGEFSTLLAGKNISVVSTDFDPYCINDLYTAIKSKGEKSILPLVLDLSNPSPAIGVNNKERSSFIERAKFDLLLALALIHHLAIGKNIALDMVAAMFAQMGQKLIIEFVPKDDEKVKMMLRNKKDIYNAYNQSNFEVAFEKYFTIIDKKSISDSGRTLYLMQRLPV